MHFFGSKSKFGRSIQLLGGLVLCFGCSPKEQPAPKEIAAAPAISQAEIDQINRFCGDCHPVPFPSSFPKSKWPEEVRQGYKFYVDSHRTDLSEPIVQTTIKYFQELAPAKVLVPRADSFPVAETSVKFELGPTISTAGTSNATAHLNWEAKSQTLFFTDMSAGNLWSWSPKKMEEAPKLISDGKNICRVTLCDWNEDGLTDYLVGELGSFPVADHQNGRVSLHISKADGGVESHVLGDHFGRVVSAVPFDYDEDGDLDVLVAEFGWIRSGAIRLLRNLSNDRNAPQMEMEILDPRHGPLGVEVADLNGDGKQDYVLAYGQEFESVEAYYNLGGGKYKQQILYSMPDPSYNSSSFQIVDLDKDGKLDIVHTCGDIMDTYIPKPFHGLRWIRNLGDDRWENRELGLLIGALQSTVADFDGDGDLDIAAAGLFTLANREPSGTFDSVCWWEQKENLEFVRHSIERDHCYHATIAAADLDSDGRMDLMVGEWPDDDGDNGAFRIYWNRPN